MSKLLLATAAVSALAAFAIPSPAQARSCLAVTVAARGVNQAIATGRAQRRLQRYITSSVPGVRSGRVSTICTGWGAAGVRPTCKSSQLVCR
jgi:hypothetical protein